MFRDLRNAAVFVAVVLALAFVPDGVLQVAFPARTSVAPASFVRTTVEDRQPVSVRPPATAGVSSVPTTVPLVVKSSAAPAPSSTTVVRSGLAPVPPMPASARYLRRSGVEPQTDHGLSCRIVETDTPSARDVECWGWRAGLGATDTGSPRRMGLSWVTKIVVGPGHACAVRSWDEYYAEVWCWGDGYDGDVGWTGKVFSDAPVLMWSGRHVHHVELGLRYGRLDAGFDDGTCGWLEWGEWDGKVVSRPA